MFFGVYDIFVVNHLRLTEKSNSKISQKSHFSRFSVFNIENNSLRWGIENFLHPLADRKTKYFYLPIIWVENIAFTTEPAF